MTRDPRAVLGAYVGTFVDALAHAGVHHVCICPGSRSTPLALAFDRHPAVRVWMHLDERSAAFFALGMAKALREPVAALSTSGTAAVNFAPAVAEARYGRAPLIVLTADRPPELREVGALQTIDQTRLYGSHVRWFCEMPLPEATEAALRHAAVCAVRAAGDATGPPAGPVHLNFPFREPLIPVFDDPAPASMTIPRATPSRRALDEGAATELAEALANARRGLIVCGPQEDGRFPPAVARLAGTVGWPLLADVLSGARFGPHHTGNTLDAYDAFLRDEKLVEDLAPDVILRFGATPVSKPLQRYIERHAGATQIVVDDGDLWNDQARVAAEMVRADPASACDVLVHALAGHEPPGETQRWAARWRAMDRVARETLTAAVNEVAVPSEPSAALALTAALPEGATVFAGNSMPVRDLETFMPGGPKGVRVLANRGASGIDGVVSAALGASAVSPGPLVLVVGDLSFYHDMNGLFAAKRHGLNATILLLNNDGGGIFSFLPQADASESRERFEELFGTPHGLEFRHAAALYGLEWHRTCAQEALDRVLSESMASPGVQVIEVRTDRRENAALHRRIWERVLEALRQEAWT
jgi:2-succinyl-5-enolpyruvyl-6-hydroxy-3-cyclohexene-1-carboxylate synthase